MDGKFRGLPDILADVATKTAGMSESQKAAKLESIFGAKAAGGLNIVMEALSKGVKDAAGNTLTGAAAVEELRKQMQNSGGAADSMASAMGGGFLGALKEIKASFSSLGEELGEGFGNALAPILRGIAQVARGITSFIKLIPGPVKTALAGLALAGATFLTFAGGVVAATGAVMGLIAAKAVLIAALKVIGVVLAATAAVMLPLILLSAGLYVAWTNNIGGIADKVTGWLKKIQLAFEAVQQLFSTGQFSGDVLAELNNGNEGIKNFAITLFVWFNRIKNFFVGFGTGFSAAIDAAAPTIDRFIKALERLFAAFMPAKEAPDEAKAKFEAFGAAGARVGDALGKVFDFLLSAITAVIDVTTGIVEGFSAATSVGGGLTGIITTLSLVFTDVVNALTGTEAATADTASGWQTLGNVVGFVAGLVVQAIQLMVTQWAIMAGVVSGVVGAIRSYLMSIFNVVINVVNLIADA
ncbi:MAG: phage tail tape measure protein, partial [Chitinophagaceae bacterium]